MHQVGRKASRRGFQLVELMFAMALFSVGFLGVLTLFVCGFGAVTHSKNLTYATFIAQSQLEEIRFTDYNNIASIPQNTVVGASIVNSQPVTTTFYRTVTVTPNAVNSLKTVLVQVTWAEKGFNGVTASQQQSLAMETVVGQSQ